MTSPPVSRPAHIEPEHPIYPVTYGAQPPCATCFRQRDLAWSAVPDGSGLIDICRDCAIALAAGRPVDLPTGEELALVWERLARLHHNRELDDDTLDDALATLRPGRSRFSGRQTVLRLTDPLLCLQGAANPATVFDIEVTGPDHDAETQVNRWRAIAGDALAELTGGAP